MEFDVENMENWKEKFSNFFVKNMEKGDILGNWNNKIWNWNINYGNGII